MKLERTEQVRCIRVMSDAERYWVAEGIKIKQSTNKKYIDK